MCLICPTGLDPWKKAFIWLVDCQAMTYLNVSKSWTCQMCYMKSSNGWTLVVLYSFNGWTQIVQLTVFKLG